MMDGLDRSHSQHLRQPVGIESIALVCGLAPPSHVAYNHAFGVRLQQIVQPLGLRPFFETDVNSRPQSSHQPNDRAGLSRDRRAHTDRATLVSYRCHGRCLVYVQREILDRLILHGSRSFPAFGLWRFQSSRRERTFNMREEWAATSKTRRRRSDTSGTRFVAVDTIIVRASPRMVASPPPRRTLVAARSSLAALPGTFGLSYCLSRR